MKISFLTLCIVATSVLARAADQPAATNAPATPGTNSVGPKIEFATPLYEFGRVTSGTQVKHDFIFTNTGDATLEITSVSPGCGCTTVGEWTHKVEPGQTGHIPINFNSTGYTTTVTKTPHVYSNDKSHPDFTLQLRGTIYRPVDITPQFVSMTISPDSDGQATAVAHIVSHEDQPITLSNITSSLRSFTAETITNTPGTNFDLTIKTVPPLEPGNNQAVITFQTSSTNVPQLNIIALAIAQPLTQLAPSQITLPPGPLASNQTFSVSIVSQSTNSIALSEPTVNVKGVEASVTATRPGRAFVANVTFPAGFEGSTNQPMVLSIKTDRPRFPQITIPITQPAPPPLATAITNSIPVRIKQ